jgi:hypothetical protein
MQPHKTAPKIEIWPAMPADDAHLLRAVIVFSLTRPVTKQLNKLKSENFKLPHRRGRCPHRPSPKMEHFRDFPKENCLRQCGFVPKPPGD